jgi:hypothetical protein
MMDRTDTVLLWLSGALVLLGIALFAMWPARAQYEAPYGGPPMWDRRYDPREEDRRWPRTYIGPQMEPCIRYGECRGPRYEDDPDESWRRVRRRERWTAL